MARVYCLSSNLVLEYAGLSPRKAVFAAYQYHNKRMNTWEYDREMWETAPKWTKHGWEMGDFWCKGEHSEISFNVSKEDNTNDT